MGPSTNAPAIAQAAEGAGFQLLGFGDNQSLWRDVYVSLTLAAQATSTIRLGTSVTNIVTRNIAVTAGAIATVNEVSGGRAFLGLGPGDSAVLNVGQRPARLAELGAGVSSIRSMLAREDVVVDGRTMHVRWSPGPVPIYLSAEGPKALDMAGRLGDGAFVSYGLATADIEAAEGHLAVGAAAAGRDPGAIETWHAARVSLADSEHEAVRGARTAMASVAHHALRLSPETRGVPTELLPAIRELNDRYETTQHALAGESVNARLVEELGLMPYLLGRYALAGTPAQCATRLAELGRSGVRRLLLMFAGDDLVGQIRRWREDVMPLVRDGG
ncbi:MAG: 5,10-methylenetetrahydromethanopterin reductase [Chloroflexota bacterium]|nr:5,10-methylenetetrahydromethanopterin reductase [Chloroflexota bacterium]